MKIDPNAPAYPKAGVQFCGLTIRAEPASRFMAGMSADPQWGPISLEAMAEISVEAADALIAELNKEPQP